MVDKEKTLGRIVNALKIVGLMNPITAIPTLKLIYAKPTVKTLATGTEAIVDAVKSDRRAACSLVREVMKTDFPVPIREFFAETRKTYNMTGDNQDCEQFMVDYTWWAKRQILAPLPDVPDAPDVKIPDVSLTGIKLPSIGDPLGDVKKGVQTTAIVLMAFVALIIYLIFVKGKGGEGVTIGQAG